MPGSIAADYNYYNRDGEKLGGMSGEKLIKNEGPEPVDNFFANGVSPVDGLRGIGGAARSNRFQATERNLVAREKLLITVTGGASAGQIFLCHLRGSVARGLNPMHRTMAGEAVGSIRITCRGRLSVYALPEFLHFIGVALGALCQHQLGHRRHFMVIAVAGLAGCVAEHAMNAVGHMGSLVGVASRAANLRYFGRVRIVLDGRVAAGAAQNAMDAGRMLGGINRDVFAAARRHSRLAVTGQAAFVPAQMRQLRLSPGTGVFWEAGGKKAGQKQ
jgi:hypothetical protein